MAAVWTTPQTWANSVLVDATQLNTHVRDNMDYLFTRPRTVSNANAAADVSTTSTSFTFAYWQLGVTGRSEPGSIYPAL